LAMAMSRHISGEPEAMRVVSRKPVAHRPAWFFGPAGLKTKFTKAAAATCGKWLERLTSKSCCAASSRNIRAPNECQNVSTLRTALAFDFFSGVTTHTALTYKSARAADTPAGLLYERCQLAHDISLHAAHVGDDRAGFERRKKLLCQRAHLRQGRAENDQVRTGNRRQQVRGGVIHRAGLFAVFQARLTPDVSGNLPRQLPAFDGQPNGPAEQANTDDGNFLELHAAKIADGGWRMEDGNAVRSAVQSRHR